MTTGLTLKELKAPLEKERRLLENAKTAISEQLKIIQVCTSSYSSMPGPVNFLIFGFQEKESIK